MEIHPGVIITYYILLIVITAIILNPWTALIAILVQLFVIALNKGMSEIKSTLIYSVILTLAFTIINGLMNHRGNTPLLMINEVPVTSEALLRGAMAGGITVALIFIFKAASCYTNNGKILYIIGKISPTAALMICMTLRFIPYYGRQLKQLKETQKALGYNVKKASSKLFWSMLSDNLESSIETQLSMKYRGYGSVKKTFKKDKGRYRFKPADLFKLMIILGLSSIIGCLISIGIYDFEFFPVIKSSGDAYIGYIFFGLLNLLPIINKIQEELRWNIYIKSKT